MDANRAALIAALWCVLHVGQENTGSAMRRRDDKPAALDHALYEIVMLTNALHEVCRPGLPPHHGSGWLEVFGIHARNLNEFFALKDFGRAYMKPSHFVTWTYTYVFDKDLARRASSQVTHLTYDREKPEEKTQWPIEPIFKALRKQSLAFLKAVAVDESLMKYGSNNLRTEELLVVLPRIRFPGDTV